MIANRIYANRMGTLAMQDSSGQPYTYKTNIGNSLTDGVEFFVQFKFPLFQKCYAGVFSSTSYMNARYLTGKVVNGTDNQSIVGNKVEAVPDWISRNGVDILYNNLSCTLLYSYTSGTFSDPLNTQNAPVTGAKGYTPAYSLLDFNAVWQINKLLTLRFGVSNILNVQYFTKRPTFYPGPGIWPSDGRNSYSTLSIKI